MNLNNYGYVLKYKDLISYLDELILINYDDYNKYSYTESDNPPDEFTFTKNDIHVDKDGRKYILIDEDSQVIRGNSDKVSQQIVELVNGQRYLSPEFKHYLKEEYNKFSLEKITK